MNLILQADSSTAPLKAQQTLLRPCILKNANLLEVHIIPVGASIQRISVPDKNGFASDIVLGFDSANTYLVRLGTLLPKLSDVYH